MRFVCRSLPPHSQEEADIRSSLTHATHMITPEEKAEFFKIAHRGIDHIDPNFRVHAQMLYDHLRHYDELTQPKAKSALEGKIRFRARQIERGSSPRRSAP
jgi:hypothetical protein